MGRPTATPLSSFFHSLFVFLSFSLFIFLVLLVYMSIIVCIQQQTCTQRRIPTGCVDHFSLTILWMTFAHSVVSLFDMWLSFAFPAVTFQPPILMGCPQDCIVVAFVICKFICQQIYRVSMKNICNAQRLSYTICAICCIDLER